jgi:transposase
MSRRAFPAPIRALLATIIPRAAWSMAWDHRQETPTCATSCSLICHATPSLLLPFPTQRYGLNPCLQTTCHRGEKNNVIRVKHQEEQAMTTTRRTYTREFKLMVVKQVAQGEKRAAQICREYDLASSVYDRWRQEYLRKGEQAFQERVPAPDLNSKQHMLELERFCGQLALENDLLKKALRQCRCLSGTP